MSADLDARKAALRPRMRNLRRVLARDFPQAAWMAGEHVEALLAALKLTVPRIAAVYHPAGAEFDPASVAETLTALGWTLALPFCRAPDEAMVFRRHAKGDRLAPDTVGILSPPSSAPVLTPDLIIAPVLAFDAQGYRLGQGGGYYDRTLDAIKQGGAAPPVVGLAYAGQEVEVVPVGEHDQRLDAILTETGYRLFP
jgi:5-formyltetrahydrofolate cyclo-ligase